MDQGFLGNGWCYGLSGEGQGVGLDGGAIAESGGDESVREAIWLILSTAIGERMGRPDFGCGIHDLVFGTMTAGSMGEVITAVTQALDRWEPRIDVLEVDAYPGDAAPSMLVIEVHYRIRETNSRFNLVYPFYLST